MGFTLQYIQPLKTKSGIVYRYRRRVPQHLIPVIGKREFIASLGSSKEQAVRKYPYVHQEFELELERATRLLEATPDAQEATQHHEQDNSPTPFERHRQLEKRIRELGFNPQFDASISTGTVVNEHSEFIKEAGDWIDHRKLGELEARNATADAILEGYRQDPETGEPVGITPEDVNLVRALNSGLPEAPKPTLDDARKLYIKERLSVSSPDDNKKNIQRLDRVFRYIGEALGCSIDSYNLEDLNRADAKKVREWMLDRGVKPASVKRDINTIRACLNHALRELDLQRIANPFNQLEVITDSNPKQERDPFPEDTLRAISKLIEKGANDELKLIWRLLKGTGCRPAEIRSLRVEDVSVDAPIPNIYVEWHEDRRIKTQASTRYVPLVGDALEAAREALETTSSGNALFPNYYPPNKMEAMSSAFRKWVRKVTKNPKHVPYSLRHNMKDWLDQAGVSEYNRDLILGHSRPGMGNKVYGSTDATLDILAKEMLKVKFP